jgi:hypothetical protein
MPSWFRPVTYLLSVVCGLVSVAVPVTASFLVPAGTFLAGWATEFTKPATATVVVNSSKVK